MAIKPELLEKFKMKQTADQGNLKSHIGEVLRIEKWEFSEYQDVDGVFHSVLAVKIADSNDIYRTEVKAFTEKFKQYIEVFGNEPVNDRPRILITGKQSKKRNEYISFTLVDDDGNSLE